MPARNATPSPSGCTAASASARWPTGLPWRSACALLSPRSVETCRIPGIFRVVFRDSNAGATAAPALLLVDADKRVIWRQDVGLSDEAPLDLSQAQSQIEALISEDA